MAEIAEIHELLESVRVTLASSMNPNREQLERLHSELDAEIRSANKRLRECDALLSEGHRSEAIQLAEQEPNLLEVVSILDFHELAEWNDFVAELGLTVTPELQIDIATDINGAYSEDEPLERLMKKFRVLSLARAPLRSRIDLLRQIAKRDVGTAYWKDDLKSYEETRIRQISDESREAISTRNYAEVRRLADELHKKPWSVKPDRRVIERIDQTMVEVKKLEAIRMLNRVTAEWQAAMDSGDPELTKSLGEKWELVAQKCDRDSQPYMDAKEKTQPMLRWMRELGQQEEAARVYAAEVKKLTKVLRSDNVTIDDIYRHYDAVAAFEEFNIPDAVQVRFEAKIAEIEKKQKMKKMATMAGVGVAVIILLAIAAKVIF